MFAGLARTHFATMAVLIRPGGTGLVVTDVLSSTEAPELLLWAPPRGDRIPPEALALTMEERIRAGVARAHPDPFSLIPLLRERELDGLYDAARLMEPWIWDMGDELVQLVYPLLVRRAS